MIEMVAPGSPPLGGHRGLTVRPGVGTALAAVSRPGWGGEARGGEGRGRGEPPRGGAGAREPPWGEASAAPKESSRPQRVGYIFNSNQLVIVHPRIKYSWLIAMFEIILNTTLLLHLRYFTTFYYIYFTT